MVASIGPGRDPLASPQIALSAADRLTLRHFRKTLPKSASASFTHSFAAIMDAERPFATDRATHGHLVVGACVVSAYRAWMTHGLDPVAAKARTREPTITIGKRTIASMMRLTAFFSKDAFESVRAYTQHRTDTAFGPSFDIHYADMEDGFVSEVTRCGYQSFLRRHDALDLLDLFCEWDRTWIDALPKAIRFHRPPTIAQGGASCRFEFRRDETP